MVLAGAVAFTGIITAEVLSPDYSTRQDIGDLGSTQPPNPVIREPSASLFNATMLVTGALVVLAAYFVYRSWVRRTFTALFAAFGVAVFGVGAFPGNVTPRHGLFALLTFFSGASPPSPRPGSPPGRSPTSVSCWAASRSRRW